MDDAMSTRDALSLGARGGVPVALSGVAGYVVVPLLAGEFAGGIDAVFAVMEAVADPVRGALALVLPAALAAGSVTLAARRRGGASRTTDAALLAGVAAVPAAAALGCYVLGSVAVAADSLARGGLSTDPAWAVVEVASVTISVFLWGWLFTVVVLLVVATGVSVGVAGGYLLARAVVRVRGPTAEANAGGAER